MNASTNFWGGLDEGRSPYHELTKTDMDFRDKFVEQYILDYDEHAAALRCGYMDPWAAEHAKRLMVDPYVRWKIKDMEEKADNDPEIEKKRIIAALNREAHNTGAGSSHSARVTALTKLATIYGLEPDPKGNVLAGNVMVVPALADVTAWEQSAKNSQEALVKNVD